MQLFIFLPPVKFPSFSIEPAHNISMREFLEGLTFSSCSTFVVLAAGDIGAKYALGLPGLGILILGPIELSVKMRLNFSFQHSL